MNEMLDRVARAIYAALHVEGFSHQDYDLLNTFQLAQVEKMARAAVKAMQVPTKAMVWDGNPDYEGFFDADVIWGRMIDPVLADKPSNG